MMHALEPVLAEVRPGLVLVYGDTNTTLAGALSCARLEYPLAHVESGMRSWDDSMPEERNRVLTDHLSGLLLCSTQTAVDNLAREGVEEGVELVGDVMADVTLTTAPLAARESDALERFGANEGEYLLVTAHRAGNVDDPEALARLVEVLLALPLPALFPVHPRTRARFEAAGVLAQLECADGLQLLPALGYLDFLQLLRHARAVLTDSGGVQKEAYLLEVPCVTLRETTEWTETVELGWNRLAGLDRVRVLAALADLERPARHPDLYGGGRAGEAVVAAVGRWDRDRPH
jgi:UDP-N-acetylglucosamine 2-epimerase (non-hydrolysing)/UDP-GlcNAc3NAcA epimerase